MNRREFIFAAGGAALAGLQSGLETAAAQDVEVFSRKTVATFARNLATQDFKPPAEVPEYFGTLGYDQYRDIKFRPEAAYWLGQQRGFTLELMHAGFIYKKPVEVHIVDNGVVQPISYSSDLFDFGPNLQVTPAQDVPLFSGVRLRAPINSPGRLDEVAVFQGATYFRSLGAGQLYGASARGLAISTAEPKGEEFPLFRSFWVEQPAEGAKTIVLHALLDSVSVTGAYTFHITPGQSTLMGIEATLFARKELAHLGLAPLTSMYLFSSMENDRFSDYRPAVHDSDTLAMAEESTKWTVRPIANPKELQISSFRGTAGIRGFGLQQRARRHSDFEDLEARYELRPSTWVEPRWGWVEGDTELVEIPSDKEFNDNIVAYWRPRDALRRGEPLTYAYWLIWGAPVVERQLARVSDTRGGLALDHSRRLFVIDFTSPVSVSVATIDDQVKPQVFASAGRLKNVVGQSNAVTGGYRVSFELDVTGVKLSELRLLLVRGDKVISETWLYRWTA